MTSVLLASDLDRTLIHPTRTFPPEWEGEARVVEIYDGRGITMASHAALADLEALTAAGAFVPVTTRSRAQLERITAIWELGTEWAICANGASVMRRGVEDPDWTAEVARQLHASAPLDEARTLFEAEIGAPERVDWMPLLRDCDERFLYSTLDLARIPPDLAAAAQSAMATIGWRAVLHGRKLYVLPHELCKGHAVRWLRDRLQVETVVGAGDSLLDVDLMAAADVAWVPADAELVDLGAVPSTARVTAERHVRAGAQIAAETLALLPARA
ncbi:hypothetical protein DSM112329_02679 [Paraconexibacter sp. AEG42_29]|uniref:Sucrose phosphatase-like domain-containing protein n=1 Tax=Paraconexibacter sp. AEG42_29 TaxID=2997339 RepID=A0AAU7AW36_9ACTN